MTSSLSTPSSIATSLRIQSIDLLRGIVMIIMALDHVRDYFHADAFLFNPVDLEKTSILLFFTRWITHYCAPVFVFLSGTSAFLVGSRKGKKELSAFLFTRGLWLVFLEVTIINFAWFFNARFSLIILAVIWALGIGMILLSAIIHLPFKAILILGILFVAGHNLLDGIHVPGDQPDAIGWSMLHEFGIFKLGDVTLFVGYPIIPWTGIMLLGYCFGSFYRPSVSAATRRKIILCMGMGAILLFIIIRLINGYGDPAPWKVQSGAVYTLLSFINVSKYPPSLLYVLVTLGPALVFLSMSENLRSRLAQYIIALGRVPLFYYILHLYFIHIAGVIAALATGYEFSDMIFNVWVTDSPDLKGYGFSLGIVYMVWAGIVLLLFPLCIWYDRYKTSHRDKRWLSYL